MRDHPAPDLLARFVRGELSGATGRPVCRMIVRHLLAGCPQCARIARRLWVLASAQPDPPPGGEPLVD